MPKFKIKMLEAYEVEIEVDGDSPESAKHNAAEATDLVIDELGGIDSAQGFATLAWRQFKAVAPIEERGAHVKGSPHKSKQKGEK